MRRRRQVGDEILKRRHVGRDAFEDEVDLARQHPALPHQRLGADEFFERAQIGVGLARQMHGGEHRDVEAEPARIEHSAITEDVALFLQRSHPAQAGRRRNADPFGQFNIGDSAVGLDFAENFEVDFVKVLRHAGPDPGLAMREMAVGNSLSAAGKLCAILLRVRCANFPTHGEFSPIWIAILA
jgi:hypothetical protein